MSSDRLAFSRVFLAGAHGSCSLRARSGATRNIHQIMRSTDPDSGIYILFVCPVNCTTATNEAFVPVQVVQHYLTRLRNGAVDPLAERLVPPGCNYMDLELKIDTSIPYLGVFAAYVDPPTRNLPALPLLTPVSDPDTGATYMKLSSIVAQINASRPPGDPGNDLLVVDSCRRVMIPGMLDRHRGETLKTQAKGCVLTRPVTRANALRLPTELAAIANANLKLYAQLEALSNAESALSKGVADTTLLPETARLYSEVVSRAGYDPDKVSKALLRLPQLNRTLRTQRQRPS